MPAGFNKGQIEYIKTIANVNGHKTYKHTHNYAQNHSVETGTQAASDNHARYKIYCLGDKPLMLPVGAIAADTDLSTDSTIESINLYDVPIESDQAVANASKRVTPECFLESVHMKMRHITNLDETIDDQSHKEFRLIVFRHREKQHASKQLASNFSNPLYDLFHGAQNVKYGPKGYRQKVDDQGNINYQAHSAYDARYERDMMMTNSVNTDDYVVMKDCRYYLGREYGGKHIYEDKFFWDHEDPIATDNNDLTYNDSDKNYCWYVFLLGINNSYNAAIDNLGHIGFSCNTYVTSG